MVHYYGFKSDSDGIDYTHKSGYDVIRLTGHDLVSFDEDETIAKTIHDDIGTNYTRIKPEELVRTERCVSIECSTFGYPMTYDGDVFFYDNGHVYLNRRGQEFYYTTSQEKTDLLFKVVEEDIAKIEQGKRNYFEDAKELCTFEEYYAYGDKNTYRTDGSVNLRGVVTNPYSVGTNYFGNGDFYNNGIKTVYNKIKEINYAFKGYRSVDYDALNYSLLYLGCSYYNTYGFILEGGCNFTTAGIAMIYGDYKDGKYHSLIAEYTIDSKDGEALYNLARSFCSKGI